MWGAYNTKGALQQHEGVNWAPIQALGIVLLAICICCAVRNRLATRRSNLLRYIAELRLREQRDGPASLDSLEQDLLRRHPLQSPRERPPHVSNIDHETGNLNTSTASWRDEAGEYTDPGAYTQLSESAVERLPPARPVSEVVPVARRRSALGSSVELRFPSEEGLPAATEHIAVAFRTSELGIVLAQQQTTDGGHAPPTNRARLLDSGRRAAGGVVASIGGGDEGGPAHL